MNNPQHSAGSPSQQLFVNLTLDDGVLTGRLVGPQLGAREAPIISKMLRERLESEASPPRAVVLDFTDISFINSAGLGACLVIHNATKAAKVKLVLYALDKELQSVFKLTRLDKLFTVAANEKKLAKLVK